MAPSAAILLLGPTGSGKSPLGDTLAERGLHGRRCAHFDFGAQLRAAVSGESPAELDEAHIAFLHDVLERGALLEDEQFHIAETILRAFLDAHPGQLVVLNGLPRHIGQARDVDGIVRVEAVVELACSPETVLERIRTNAGGDRSGRTDDTLDAVRRKLALYAERTEPLVEHYRAEGAKAVVIEVGTATSATEA